MEDNMHVLCKLRSTLRMLFCLGMARTFGEYQHSVYDHNNIPYAKYKWRNHTWAIPTGPIEEETQ